MFLDELPANMQRIIIAYVGSDSDVNSSYRLASKKTKGYVDSFRTAQLAQRSLAEQSLHLSGFCLTAINLRNKPKAKAKEQRERILSDIDSFLRVSHQAELTALAMTAKAILSDDVTVQKETLIHLNLLYILNPQFAIVLLAILAKGKNAYVLFLHYCSQDNLIQFINKLNSSPYASAIQNLVDCIVNDEFIEQYINQFIKKATEVLQLKFLIFQEASMAEMAELETALNALLYLVKYFKQQTIESIFPHLLDLLKTSFTSSHHAKIIKILTDLKLSHEQQLLLLEPINKFMCLSNADILFAISDLMEKLKWPFNALDFAWNLQIPDDDQTHTVEAKAVRDRKISHYFNRLLLKSTKQQRLLSKADHGLSHALYSKPSDVYHALLIIYHLRSSLTDQQLEDYIKEIIQLARGHIPKIAMLEYLVEYGFKLLAHNPDKYLGHVEKLIMNDLNYEKLYVHHPMICSALKNVCRRLSPKSILHLLKTLLESEKPLPYDDNLVFIASLGKKLSQSQIDELLPIIIQKLSITGAMAISRIPTAIEILLNIWHGISSSDLPQLQFLRSRHNENPLGTVNYHNLGGEGSAREYKGTAAYTAIIKAFSVLCTRDKLFDLEHESVMTEVHKMAVFHRHTLYDLMLFNTDRKHATDDLEFTVRHLLPSKGVLVPIPVIQHLLKYSGKPIQYLLTQKFDMARPTLDTITQYPWLNKLLGVQKTDHGGRAMPADWNFSVDQNSQLFKSVVLLQLLSLLFPTLNDEQKAFYNLHLPEPKKDDLKLYCIYYQLAHSLGLSIKLDKKIAAFEMMLQFNQSHAEEPQRNQGIKRRSY